MQEEARRLMLMPYPGSKMKAIDRIMAGAPHEYGEFRSAFCGNEPLLWELPTDLPRWINDIDEMVYLTLTAMRDDPTFIRRFQRLRKIGLPNGFPAVPECFDLFNRIKDRIHKKDPVDYLFIRRLAHKQVVGFHRKYFASFTHRKCADGSALRPMTVERMREARRILQGVRITNLDYKEVLRAPTDHGSVWCYLDPPYLIWDHSSTIYQHEFTPQQRAELKRAILRAPKTHKVMLSVEESDVSHSEYVLDERFEIRYREYTSQMSDSKNKKQKKKRKHVRDLLIRNYTL